MVTTNHWADRDGNPPPADVANTFAKLDAARDTPPEPTVEQCHRNAEVGQYLWAFWWPTMGGYAGKAVVRSGPGDCCQTVWVWHDGEFPFAGAGTEPARFTVGDTGEWIKLGHFLGSLPGPPI